MATGRSIKLVAETGVYLVAAELSRRGLLAATFNPDVPRSYIAAESDDGRRVWVQVRSKRSQSWQFAKITQFFEVSSKGKQQIVGETKVCPVKRLIVVFVDIGRDRRDRFYIIRWQTLRGLLVRKYKQHLAKHNGIRPQNWDTRHCAIYPKDLRPHEGKWELVERNLR